MYIYNKCLYIVVVQIYIYIYVHIYISCISIRILYVQRMSSSCIIYIYIHMYVYTYVHNIATHHEYITMLKWRRMPLALSLLPSVFLPTPTQSGWKTGTERAPHRPHSTSAHFEKNDTLCQSIERHVQGTWS